MANTSISSNNKVSSNCGFKSKKSSSSAKQFKPPSDAELIGLGVDSKIVNTHDRVKIGNYAASHGIQLPRPEGSGNIVDTCG